MTSIAIVSPYPGPDRYLDGWMSRIKTIDIVLQKFNRTYIDFQDGFDPLAVPEIIARDDRVTAYRVNPKSPKHADFVRRVFDQCGFVYIHTMHQAEHMLPYFDPKRMYIDIHGVVPEEELMMGSPERSAYYAKVEKEVFERASRVGVVTRAMRNHYQKKYPGTSVGEYLHLPVFDFAAANEMNSDVGELISRRHAFPSENVIYAGGSQVWQCVDLMLDTMKAASTGHSFEIFSHNIDTFREELSRRNMSPSTFRGYVSKEQLVEIYRRSSYGFVLREDSVVNRVASPTKICDYCAGRIIPIVKFVEIGDFCEYGYAYVTVDDYRDGFVPDGHTQKWMIEQNVACLETMTAEFETGCERILDMAESS